MHLKFFFFFLEFYHFMKQGDRGIACYKTQIIYLERKNKNKGRGGQKPKPSGKTNTSSEKNKRERSAYKQKEQYHTTD